MVKKSDSQLALAPKLTLAEMARSGSTILATLDPEFAAKHAEFIHAATADNTRKAYLTAVHHFLAWGGLLPASIDQANRYLVHYSGTLSPRTLAVRVAALSKWHKLQGFQDVFASGEVRGTLTGISRMLGKPKKKAKALPVADLEAIIRKLDEDPTFKAVRDSALLQVGFFAGMRRSELVAIQVSDIAWEPNGIKITLPRSKTDQTGEGIVKAVPYGDGICCPGKALKRWLEMADITFGPVFRPINNKGKLSDRPLGAGRVSDILSARAAKADLGYVPELSSHSLRRGMATSAHRAGANFLDIKKQGGWRNDATVHGYIEEANLFDENAAGVLLGKRKPQP